MNNGALAAAGVALIGWFGLWLYLWTLRARLGQALAELDVAREESAPAQVRITEVEHHG